MKRSLLAFLLASLLAACASSKTQTVHFSDSNESARLELAKIDCLYDFEGVIDARPQRKVGGYGYAATLENLRPYIDREVASWMPEINERRGAAAMRLELMRFYHEVKSTAAFYNVVFALQIEKGKRDFIRGQYSSMTWFATLEELEAKMQRAVNEGLIELHASLEGRCG